MKNYREADARLREAALAVVDYLHDHHGVMRANSNVAIELHQAWLEAERPAEYRRRMREE